MALRLLPHQRARALYLLKLGTAEALQEAHDLSRNDGDLHTRVHVALALEAARDRRLGELRAQTIQATMAAPSSLLRRLGGYTPDQESQGSLLRTWRQRPKAR